MLALVGLKANAAMYIVGTNPFGGWNPAVGLEMELQTDGSYSLDATLTTDATIYFIFTEAIGDWTAVNGNRWDPGTGSDLTVQSDVEFTAVKGNTDKSFKFTGTIGEKYTFTFNPTTKKAKVSGYVEPITEIIYTALGNSADIFGETWNTGLTQNVMTLDETDGLYKLVKNGVEIAGGFTLEYKVHDNLGNWYPDGPNQTYYFEESGTYDLTFTFNAGTSEVGLTVTKVGDGPEVNPLTGNLYMMGHVNGNGWAGNVGVPMATADENIFTLTDAVIADANEGYGYFSFASKLGADENDWAFQAYRRGSLANDTIIEAGVLTDLGAWGTSNAFRALAGTYDVTVNLSAGTVLLTAKEAPQPEVDDVYIIGDVNNFSTTGWDPTKGAKLTYNEGIYTGEVATTPQEGQELAYIGFSKKIADAESENPWGDIEAYRFGPVADEGTENWVMTESLLNADCELDLIEGTHYTIAIPAGTWTFTVDLANGTFKIDGTWPTDTVIPEPEMVYTLVGDAAVFGTAWDTNNEANNMTKGENGIYTWTKEEVALYNNFQYKVVGDHDYANYEWPTNGENWPAVLPEGAAIYNVLITFDPEAEVKLNCTLTKTGEAPVIEHTYTVAGTPNLFGSEWAPTDTTNDMVKGEDGIYTWTKTIEVTDTMAIKFKVVEDHNWDNASWPNEDYATSINDPGTYDIVITFDPETKAVNFTARKQGGHTYTVAGAPASIFGTEWDETNTANDMTLGEDGLYIWTKAIEVTDSTLIEAKVCEDHSWNVSYPEGYGFNATVNVGPGNYNLVVTFDPETQFVTITAVEPWALGDVNHDHFVNVADVTALIKYVLTSGDEPEVFYREQANVDGDAAGIFNVADVTALIQLVLNQ